MPALLPFLVLQMALPTESAPDTLPTFFYNRAGSTDAMRTAEITRCRLITTAPMGSAETTAPLTPAEPESFSRDTGPLDSVDSCMVTRGWRIYALSERDREMLLRLSPCARARALGALAGVRRPLHGRLIRGGGTPQLRDPAAR
ncbi:MAG: hypothetical protein EOP58_15295 [Sphingomonadales bacterium]|nr:MAG: hypothetical protein EOP58_15295 [Sphingomonadales bacterium]